MMVDITGDDDEDDAVAESNCLAADATADSHTMVGNIIIKFVHLSRPEPPSSSL